MTKIDFVIMWVDGSDQEWIKEKQKYSADKGDQSEVRFRDWETLRYWFRGVEKYAPWVNRIHFVTWGHLPSWLDISNKKINIVRHDEFIPEEYLPTFSSHTIELNLHRIKDLSDRFVLFNDDTFIINETHETDFFLNGVPCDMGVLYPGYASKDSGVFSHILLNDALFFTKYFNIKEVLKTNRNKWFNVCYGKHLLKTIMMLPFPEFTGFLLHHQPASYFKHTLEDVWLAEQECLENTCKMKFRTKDDVNQYVFRYWQLGKGEFAPSNFFNRGNYVSVGEKSIDYIQTIVKSKYKLLCLNDADMEVNFAVEKNKMIKAFEEKFPSKSSFEL